MEDIKPRGSVCTRVSRPWTGAALTEVISHQALVLEGVFRPNSNDGPALLHGLESLGSTGGFSPFHLLFQDVKHGDDVAKAAWHLLVCAVSHVSKLKSDRNNNKETRSHLMSHLCRGTFPYVTDNMATSSSSGEALKAKSMAMTSSTPGKCSYQPIEQESSYTTAASVVLCYLPGSVSMMIFCGAIFC